MYPESLRTDRRVHTSRILSRVGKFRLCLSVVRSTSNSRSAPVSLARGLASLYTSGVSDYGKDSPK